MRLVQLRNTKALLVSRTYVAPVSPYLTKVTIKKASMKEAFLMVRFALQLSD